MDNPRLHPKFISSFKLLGKPWTWLIICVVLTGKRRFSDISATIPRISDKMLVARLKELETAGIMERHVYPETPLRVEYELTEKGRDLKTVIDQVQQWANTWLEDLRFVR
ncbi:helix-turn-helix domain-containing protein [Paenibacillus filicis]|uniref:Helix-turn-helix domain-containing protein n=1 Tax=Paenibacillus gyeongsangnamensis TaxID=3388067 RepID=A0ABT4QHS8_9BACL|nr:helix-turn-helix domain-containing protein [Paenibacillus filicis]MCZ8516291.1 helix-turn-helix domain-containing protein [Paenibacillus filicis]